MSKGLRAPFKPQEGKKSSGKSNPRLASLRKSLEALHVRIGSLEGLMKQVFNGYVKALYSLTRSNKQFCVAHQSPSYNVANPKLEFSRGGYELLVRINGAKVPQL